MIFIENSVLNLINLFLDIDLSLMTNQEKKTAKEWLWFIIFCNFKKINPEVYKKDETENFDFILKTNEESWNYELTGIEGFGWNLVKNSIKNKKKVTYEILEKLIKNYNLPKNGVIPLIGQAIIDALYKKITKFNNFNKEKINIRLLLHLDPIIDTFDMEKLSNKNRTIISLINNNCYGSIFFNWKDIKMMIIFMKDLSNIVLKTLMNNNYQLEIFLIYNYSNSMQCKQIFPNNIKLTNNKINNILGMIIPKTNPKTSIEKHYKKIFKDSEK